MQVTPTVRNMIAGAIRQDAQRKGMNQARHANHIAINSSIYSRIMKGETERLLADGEWIRVGMELGADLSGMGWKTATTATWSTISVQLEYCKNYSISGIFCDEKGIGKSYTARMFALGCPNVAYVDCSQNKTKKDLIRAIARKFGFDYNGRLKDVRDNMIYNILTLDKPLLILDEAGDLADDAWLEVKAIWNALENQCGFYMMGANGLRTKIDRKMLNKKVGFEEIFDRYGDRYQNVTETLTEAEKAAFKRHQATVVLKANLPEISKETATDLLNSCSLNLRRLYIEIVKYKNPVAA